ncbi:hypothetical protein H8S10_04860 [Clostridium sp. NSJ-49]|uniref:Uncharacterized protein n=1 Tax=Clostridium disporicum TaxID=84024 RepID=A0A174JH74_9CLOT|nr:MULTISPECIES: hypothetical protein [Clostridium]MBC5624784.1 hypothetical protein [Clostridium sp. NSJ-49]MCD2502474.1 hypothetical protein [Clostridium sp. NSJ-145]MDU6341397.1 hypothetical protein [Clostridium sp.]CUO96490.1 Uncharacterised protein [Clostridium disporicum]
MERISSSFFMLALILYYIPKILKIRKNKYIKAHIAIGSVSILAMIIALIQKFGQPDFIKYIGFSIIMILIGLTGYFFKNNPKLYRKLHIIATLSFFVYLFVSIKFL